MSKRKANSTLYLETIDRKVLDFDFEKLCSVSLLNMNIYCCLTCGKYFQGRGPNSHAYYHSLEEDHHCFVNLENARVFILPQNTRVDDPVLDDIRYNINPTFTPDEVENLTGTRCKDLFGKSFITGVVGLNSLKTNNYINAVAIALAHVVPIRDYFLLNIEFKQDLCQKFGLLIRKIYNQRAFKGHVSPHEFVQQVGLDSKKQFTIGVTGDPCKFLPWFLNVLHNHLKAYTKSEKIQASDQKRKSSVIHDAFQGELEIQSQAVISIGDANGKFNETDFSSVYTPFLFLTLELPPTPLFTETESAIPQVPLFELLQKFNGRPRYEGDNVKKYSIKKLPKYLIFSYKRFTKNGFVDKMNPTIVNFPLSNLDLKPYVSKNTKETGFKYDLLANIAIQDQIYKVQVIQDGHWFEIQDLIVTEIVPEVVSLSETCIQIWKKQH